MGGKHLYDCSFCEKNPAFYALLGHDGPPKGGMWRENLVDGRPLQICPVRLFQIAEEVAPEMLAEFNRHVHEYYPHYAKGHLLLAGGVANQPAITMEYMREIDRLRALTQAKHDEIKDRSFGSED